MCSLIHLEFSSLIKFCVTLLDKKKDMSEQIRNVIGNILRAIFSNLINVILHAGKSANH